MKDNYFVVASIIDRSGSMSGLVGDTIGGFNSFLKDQKEIKGRVDFSLVLFDSSIETVCFMKPVEEVRPLDGNSYKTRGMTALNDAIGSTIDSIGKKLDGMSDKDRPSKVIISILTDGAENSSREYTTERISEIIKEQQDKYSWEFIYLAANQDAFAVGSAYNFKSENIQNFVCDSDGIKDAYRGMSIMTSSYMS